MPASNNPYKVDDLVVKFRPYSSTKYVAYGGDKEIFPLGTLCRVTNIYNEEILCVEFVGADKKQHRLDAHINEFIPASEEVKLALTCPVQRLKCKILPNSW